MRRARRGRLLFFLSIACAAAPFVAGTIRALQTGSDFRLLWMAFASFCAAAAVVAVGTSRIRSALTLSALTFVATTLVAGLLAFRLGATASAGVWPVAVVLGLCWATSSAFYVLSRSR